MSFCAMIYLPLFGLSEFILISILPACTSPILLVMPQCDHSKMSCPWGGLMSVIFWIVISFTSSDHYHLKNSHFMYPWGASSSGWQDGFPLANPQFFVEIAEKCWLLRIHWVLVGNASWPICPQIYFRHLIVIWFSMFKSPVILQAMWTSCLCLRWSKVSCECPLNFRQLVYKWSKNF